MKQKGRRKGSKVETSSRTQTILHYIGANVKRLRSARGWTQKELAKASGRDERLIQKLETGKQNPTVAALIDVADALVVSLTDLFAVADFDEDRAPSKK